MMLRSFVVVLALSVHGNAPGAVSRQRIIDAYRLLIRERKPDQCIRAFLNNNYFGMSVFIGIALDYLFR